MQRILYSILTTVVVLIFSSGLSAGTFSESYGFSSKGIGMGNAMTAIVDDWSSVFYNVSGLGKTYKIKGSQPDKREEATSTMSLKKRISQKQEPVAEKNNKAYLNQVALNVFYTMPLMDIDISRDDVYGDTELDFMAAIIGAAIDLNILYKMPRFISSARMGIGLGSILPNYAAKINDIDLGTHNFQRYGRNIQVTKIMLGFGFGFLGDTFGVGFGTNMSFGGEGVNKLSNVVMNTETTQVPDAQTKMDQTTEAFITAGLYFSPGNMFPVVNGLEIGVAYRQESFLQIYPVKNDAVMKVGSITMPMEIAMYGFYTPHIISWGVAYSFKAGSFPMTVSLDCDFQMWSRFDFSPTKKIIHDALVSETYENKEDGSLYAIPDFRDIFVPKIGISFSPIDNLAILAGYYFQMAFTPDKANTGKINILDNDKHVGSLGAEFALPKFDNAGGPIILTLSYQFQYHVERQVVKIEPDEWDPSYAYSGMVHSVIFEVTMKI